MSHRSQVANSGQQPDRGVLGCVQGAGDARRRQTRAEQRGVVDVVPDGARSRASASGMSSSTVSSTTPSGVRR
jgi:hypothetical protein